MFGAHYLNSWTPNDNAPPGTAVEPGRATVYGAEVHIDGDAIGNGYLGYSRADVEDVFPLGNALQLVHGSTGRSFKESFFGARSRDPAVPTTTNDAGTVDTVLFQYSLSLAQYLGRLPLGARELRTAVYSMFNHAVSPRDPSNSFDREIDTYKLKLGSEVQVDLLSFLTLATQFDYVQPDLDDTEQGYTAITPRLIFRTTWATKERVMLSYTHFFLGDTAYPSSPFSDELEADPDLFTLTAIMSF